MVPTAASSPEARAARPTWSWAPREPRCRLLRASLLSVDREQLDLEHERRPARDGRRVPVVAVRDVGGAHEPRLLADLHLADTLGPALDDLVEAELRRPAVLGGAVEDGAVRQ